MTDNFIRVDKPILTTGPMIVIQPILASVHGLNEALVYSHLYYKYENSKLIQDGVKYLRMSYTRMQKEMPFLCARTIKNIVKRLQVKGVIEVEKTGRVNHIFVSSPMQTIPESLQHLDLPDTAWSALPVLPSLAKFVSIKEAMILQQIHIRCHKEDGNHWVIKSYEQWMQSTFFFMDRSNLIKCFRNLFKQGLILIRNYSDDNSTRNGYRIDYERLAILMQYKIAPFTIKPGTRSPLTPNKELVKSFSNYAKLKYI